MKTSSRALERLNREGLELPVKPEFEMPSIPTDLTTIPDPDLMSLFAELTAWTDHLRGRAAVASIDEKEMHRALEVVEGESLLGRWQAKTPVTVAKNAVDVDPQVTRAKDAHAEAEAYRKLVETLADSTERDVSLISRELTRRSAGAQQRANRWMA